MSPSKKAVAKPSSKKVDRPLSDSDLKKVSGGAGPINGGKVPLKPADPING